MLANQYHLCNANDRWPQIQTASGWIASRLLGDAVETAAYSAPAQDGPVRKPYGNGGQGSILRSRCHLEGQHTLQGKFYVCIVHILKSQYDIKRSCAI